LAIIWNLEHEEEIIEKTPRQRKKVINDNNLMQTRGPYHK